MSDPVLYRTPVVDANGKLTREWVRFFDALAVATGTITNIQNTTVIQGQVSAFDDVPQRDTQREITNALLGIYPDTPQPVTADPLAALALIDTPQPQTSDPMVTLGLFEPRPLTILAGTNITLAETAGTVTINASGGGGGGSGSFSIDVGGTLVAGVVGGSFALQVNTTTVATYS